MKEGLTSAVCAAYKKSLEALNPFSTPKTTKRKQKLPALS